MLYTNSSDTSVAYTGDDIRDLATRAGTYRMIRTTLSEYLAGLCLFDPATKNGHWDISVLNVPFQRMVIPIKKNAIKKRMLRDMLRGGTLPPTVLVHLQNERSLVVVLAANRSDLHHSRSGSQMIAGQDTCGTVCNPSAVSCKLLIHFAGRKRNLLYHIENTGFP